MSVRKIGGTWYWEFMYESRRYYGSFNGKNGNPTAADEREALDLEAVERIKVRQGTFHNSREELKDFSTFVDKVYMPFAKENHAWPQHAHFRAKVLKEHFSGRSFDEITMMTVVSFINKRLASDTIRKAVQEDGTKTHRRRSPVTVSKEVTLLSSIFEMAKTEKVSTSNPCLELPASVRKRIPARVKRSRYLILEEEKNLFEQLADRRLHLNPIVRLALLTGMRRGEILRLRRGYINFSTVRMFCDVRGERVEVMPGWLLIDKTKNGRHRVIPMSRKVRALLSLLCEDATAGHYVFTNPSTGSYIHDIKTGFTSACEDAGISGLTFHDLRHTWSTRAAEMGVIEEVRRDILGHTSSSMTGDYTPSTPEARERAMEAVANYSRKEIDSVKDYVKSTG